MAYTPDPTDPTAPLDTEKAATAAAEFRSLKLMLKQTIVQAGNPSGGFGHAGDSTLFNPLATGATEVVDTLGEFAAGVFTATQAGYYEISAVVSFNSAVANSTSCSLFIYKNAAPAALSGDSGNSTGINDIKRLFTRCFAHLATGDTINMFMLATVPNAIGYSGPNICVKSIQKG